MPVALLRVDAGCVAMRVEQQVACVCVCACARYYNTCRGARRAPTGGHWQSLARLVGQVLGVGQRALGMLELGARGHVHAAAARRLSQSG